MTWNEMKWLEMKWRTLAPLDQCVQCFHINKLWNALLKSVFLADSFVTCIPLNQTCYPTRNRVNLLVHASYFVHSFHIRIPVYFKHFFAPWSNSIYIFFRNRDLSFPLVEYNSILADFESLYWCLLLAWVYCTYIYRLLWVFPFDKGQDGFVEETLP